MRYNDVDNPLKIAVGCAKTARTTAKVRQIRKCATFVHDAENELLCRGSQRSNKPEKDHRSIAWK